MCWHYDHCKGRSAKGINLLNALYHSGHVSIPVAFEVVKKPHPFCDIKTRKFKRAAEFTKNELMRSMRHLRGECHQVPLCPDRQLVCVERELRVHPQERQTLHQRPKGQPLGGVDRNRQERRALCADQSAGIDGSTGGARLAKSPTRTVTTQNNHLFMTIYAVFKLECLKIKHKINHFAIRAKLFIKAKTALLFVKCRFFSQIACENARRRN